MANVPREYFQDIFYVILLITYRKKEREGEVSCNFSHKLLRPSQFLEKILEILEWFTLEI